MQPQGWTLATQWVLLVSGRSFKEARTSSRLEREGLVTTDPQSREPFMRVCDPLGYYPPSPRDDLDGQIRHMLFSWAERQAGRPGAVELLVQALEQSDRRDVAEEVRAVLELGRHKYQDSIRRTGLAAEDSALPGTSASQSTGPAQA